MPIGLEKLKSSQGSRATSRRGACGRQRVRLCPRPALLQGGRGGQRPATADRGADFSLAPFRSDIRTSRSTGLHVRRADTAAQLPRDRRPVRPSAHTDVDPCRHLVAPRHLDGCSGWPGDPRRRRAKKGALTSHVQPRDQTFTTMPLPGWRTGNRATAMGTGCLRSSVFAECAGRTGDTSSEYLELAGLATPTSEGCDVKECERPGLLIPDQV